MIKKISIIVASVLVLIIALLLLLPIFFKGDILKMVEKQSANYINAELVIGDVSLSFFKDFPNLNVGLKEVVIIGKGEFAGDTLATIPLFQLSVNVKSALFGNELIVNKVLLSDAGVFPTVNANGVSNWDIAMGGDTEEVSTTEPSSSDGALQLKDIEVRNLRIDYSDFKTLNYASVESIDLKVKGNFSEENTTIFLDLLLNNLSFRMGNSTLLSNCNMKWNSEMAANLKELNFEFKKNDLSLNDLKLNLTGGVSVLENDRYKVDLLLNAPDTKFESLLALVPKDFQKYIEGLTATGDFNLSVKAQGDYYENHLPAIDAIFAVNNAKVKYASLPESIEAINLDLSVKNPGGSIDSTVVDLKTMSFTVASNPFNLFAKVVNLSDPAISGGAVGVINFESLKRALPLEGITLKGMLTTDITFNGKYQYIEKEEYEKFTAKGVLSLKDILIVNKDYPKGIAVESGTIVVTPAKLNLTNLKAKVNSSDFALQGSIFNYLPYIFKNQLLKGNFSLTSKLINLNEFMVATDTTATQTAAATSSTGAIAIPKNVDFQLNTAISKVLFDELTISNVKGNVQIAGGVATLSNLGMNLLEGEMVMSGKYDTKNPQVPSVDFSLNISDFDIHSMYNSFSMVKKALPIAMNCEGKLSTKMKFTAQLDKEMSPVMTTLNGGGTIDTKGILINENPAMNQLAAFIKNEELSRLSISKLKVDFKIVNGDITVEPFTTTLAGNPLTIYGTQTVAGAMNYTMSINVKREMFGKEIDKLLKPIPGSNNIKNLDIDVKIGGTLDKPSIKPDLTKAITAVAKAAEKELLEKAKGGIIKGIGDLFKKK